MSELPIELEFKLQGDWYASAEALLDEHHVVAVSDCEDTLIDFGSHVTMQMEQLADTEVCPLYGRLLTSLDDLAYMLAHALPGSRRIGANLDAIADALREKHPGTKRRFIVWHDADALMQRAPGLFDEVLDVLMGVAAEREYASEDTLMLGRCLFIGSPKLLEAEGFGGWLREGQSKPLWEVVSGLPKPPVRAVRVAN